MSSREPRQRDQSGMNTTEYAVGTVAACGFACMLIQVIPAYRTVILNALMRVVELHFGWGPFDLPL